MEVDMGNTQFPVSNPQNPHIHGKVVQITLMNITITVDFTTVNRRRLVRLVGKLQRFAEIILKFDKI